MGGEGGKGEKEASNNLKCTVKDDDTTRRHGFLILVTGDAPATGARAEAARVIMALIID